MTDAFKILVQRLEAAQGSPAEQLRVLGAIQEFVASVTKDALNIAADCLDEDEQESSTDGDGY